MKTKDMTYVALFTAVMGALGLVPPIFLSFTPVPITLQTMGVMLAGGILGARLGALSQFIFLCLVAVGIPLLSGGRGGMSVFFSPSAGYLISYIFAAFFIGWTLSKLKTLTFTKVFITNVMFGILLVYAFGIPVQAMLLHIPFWKSLQLSLVYIPGDCIKAIIAAYLITKVRKVVTVTGRSNTASM